MDFKILSDLEVEARTKNAVSEERRITNTVLQHLREIEARRIYAKRGYPSLFEYAVKELCYSNDAAYRRIASMRLVREIPEAEEKLIAGTLNVAVLSQAQSFFKKDGQLSCEEKIEFLDKLDGKSKLECQRIIATRLPEAARPEKTKPISENLTRIEFTADEELMRKLGRIQELASHSGVESYQNLFRYMADKVLNELEKKTGVIPVRESVRPDEVNPSRVPSRNIQRDTWQSGNGQCSYVDPLTQRRCEARKFIQFEHVEPWALGGASTKDNLSLLCSAHNQLRAFQMFGEKKMNSYLKQK